MTPTFSRPEIFAMTQTWPPNQTEPIDPEVLPLVEAMRAVGLNTEQSCSGHGGQYPSVFWLDGSAEDEARSMAFVRHIMAGANDAGVWLKVYKNFRQWPWGLEHYWGLEVKRADDRRDMDAWAERCRAAAALVSRFGAQS